MKLKTYSCISLYFLITIVGCKVMEAQSFTYGPRAGINIMKTVTNNTDGNLYSLGYDFGLYGQTKVYNKFSLALEINFTQKKYADSYFKTSSFFKSIDTWLQSMGSILPIEISIEDLLATYLGSSASLINDTVFTSYRDMTNFTYVEVPLLISYKYKRLTVEAGPDFSFLYGIHTKSVLKQEIPLMDVLPVSLLDSIPYGSYFTNAVSMLFPAYKDTVFEDGRSTNNFSSFNMGFLAGINYEVYDNLFLGLRYSYMFSNLYAKNDRTAHHSLVNLSVKYNLRSLFKNKSSF